MKQSPVTLDLCLRKTRSGKSDAIVMPSSSKSSVFEMFSVHEETQTPRFQIPPV